MRPKPTIRKIGSHWACEWPTFGFSGGFTTYHSTWQDAVVAAGRRSTGATGGTAERGYGWADGVSTVSAWTPLSYSQGVQTWPSCTRYPSPLTYTTTTADTWVWWRGGPEPPTPSGGPVPVGR